MFARTERLLLRPGFAEDARDLARAIGEEAIVRNLARAPWPYGEEDARAFLTADRDPLHPALLMVMRTAGRPQIVGGVGYGPRGNPDELELGYWVARPYWGLGLATEAGRAVLAMARASGVRRLHAGHFVDNPASGAVLRKLGFRPTGSTAPLFSKARGHEADCALFECDLDADAATDTDRMPVGLRGRASPDDDFRQQIRLIAA
jgi:RimJ/RimL family protein N-acetyltransferase